MRTKLINIVTCGMYSYELLESKIDELSIEELDKVYDIDSGLCIINTRMNIDQAHEMLGYANYVGAWLVKGEG